MLILTGPSPAKSTKKFTSVEAENSWKFQKTRRLMRLDMIETRQIPIFAQWHIHSHAPIGIGAALNSEGLHGRGVHDFPCSTKAQCLQGCTSRLSHVEQRRGRSKMLFHAPLPSLPQDLDLLGARHSFLMLFPLPNEKTPWTNPQKSGHEAWGCEAELFSHAITVIQNHLDEGLPSEPFRVRKTFPAVKGWRTTRTTISIFPCGVLNSIELAWYSPICQAINQTTQTTGLPKMVCYRLF